MDGQRFDHLARTLSQRLTRRRLGGLLAIGGLGFPILAAEDAAAKPRKKKKTSCKPGTIRCGKVCVDKRRNPKHCGGCNRSCPRGVGCANGRCQTACQSPNTQCGADCVDTQTDERYCGDCTTSCETNETCDNGKCVPIVTCAAGCRADQTCQNESGYCPCSRECGAGWCGDCCTDGQCQGDAAGNHCIPSPGKPGNYICGCRQPTDPADTREVRPCGPQNACSYCCSDTECSIRYGAGWICPAGNIITGRNCCVAPGAECGGSNSICCSNICSPATDGKFRCSCFPVNTACDAATAHYCCSGNCAGGRCVA